MNMRLSIFSLLILFVCCSRFSYAQEVTDSLKPDTINKLSHYEKRVHRYREGWSNVIPTFLKTQFAGGMGLLSFGFGWDYGHHQQWETDLLFGYLPKYDSKDSKMTMTLKQNFIPWQRPLGKNSSINPFICGLYLNTVFDDQFWVKEPDRYPKGYYGFSSKIRVHVFVGQRFTHNIRDNRFKHWKDVSFFYELSTCDLYVASAFANKYLKLKDIVSLSLGLKFQIF